MAKKSLKTKRSEEDEEDEEDIIEKGEPSQLGCFVRATDPMNIFKFMGKKGANL